MKQALFVLPLLGAAAVLLSQPEPVIRVGPLAGGRGFLLPSGWLLRPAGRQAPLDTYPMSSLLTPDGKHLIVLHGGYNAPSVAVLDAATLHRITEARVPDAWMGMALTPNGRLLYVSGGSRSEVYEFALTPEGQLEQKRTFSIADPKQRTHRDFIGDLQFDPNGRLLYAADLFHDQVVVINPSSGRVIERFKTGRRPYRILFHPDGKSFFVSSWADAAVYQHETDNGNRLNFSRVGPHPTDLLWREKLPTDELKVGDGDEDDKLPAAQGDAAFPWKARLFVTLANTNSVAVLGVSESKELARLETINVALYPRHPAGMTPSAMALSADKNRLFVVCSDANAVAVVEVNSSRSRVTGFIPTGWYPIAARAMTDGRLLVFNSRGSASYPNPRGPNPAQRAARTHLGMRSDQYVAQMQTGSVSIIDGFDEPRLTQYTRTVLENTAFRESKLDEAHQELPGHPVPRAPGEPSPIEHVIYVVKENRTYDQILGDLGKGNGDPSLTLFGEEVTPNHHKLAREFVLLDNFYVNGDVSADGHNWSTAAIAPDYVQKMWPNSYAGRRKHYDYEGGEAAALPPSGRIWHQVMAAGLSMRNYGYWAENKPQAGPDGVHIARLRDLDLAPVTNMKYRAYELEYRDTDRVKVFLDDVAQWETTGAMPRFMTVRIGNDHTYGLASGKLAPKSMVADNDYALGLLVEGVSRSKFWAKTAIFVLEDDAQNGPDHVDSHRSPAFVISPYVKRGSIDSTLYNTTSMLRTMELILGLNPMTHFDAGATPMTRSLTPIADLKSYSAEKPRISLEVRNPADTALARRTEAMDFRMADAIDDNELNAILWLGIKGTAPPAPVRSFFAR
ncbi:MAG: beta-propeller fold lactonase family protein [Acidobacteria bacterium]|nr:beta-propeller fold lactonase family protein [Acidobacteriota bacterium]